MFDVPPPRSAESEADSAESFHWCSPEEFDKTN